jgi:glycosyltransferase involved in cell wall biosynthesis
MTNDFGVSIIIPAHNAENSIIRCLDSALAQGDNVEVIVVNDRSTDGTVSKIKDYHANVLVLDSIGKGAPAARNTGLMASTNPWVQFLDADDYLIKGKIERQINHIKNNLSKNIDVLYGPVTIVQYDHKSGNLIGSVDHFESGEDIYELLALWRMPQTGGPLWRKEALQSVGGWTESKACCQEYDLYLKMLVARKIFLYDESCKLAVYCRESSGTLSTKEPALVRAERSIIEKQLEEYLTEKKLLTRGRKRAIALARLTLARSAYAESATEALEHISRINSRRFVFYFRQLNLYYKIVYFCFGFLVAEKIASLQRKLCSK